MSQDEIVTTPDITEVERYEQAVAMSYQGPLPPAREFERYEIASTGAGKAILDLAENSSRRTFEAQLDTNRTARHITWSVVAIVAVVTTAVAVVSLALIDAGSETLGAIGSIAGAFFIGLGVLVTWIRGRPTKSGDNES